MFSSESLIWMRKINTENRKLLTQPNFLLFWSVLLLLSWIQFYIIIFTNIYLRFLDPTWPDTTFCIRLFIESAEFSITKRMNDQMATHSLNLLNKLGWISIFSWMWSISQTNQTFFRLRLLYLLLPLVLEKYLVNLFSRPDGSGCNKILHTHSVILGFDFSRVAFGIWCVPLYNNRTRYTSNTKGNNNRIYLVVWYTLTHLLHHADIVRVSQSMSYSPVK